MNQPSNSVSWLGLLSGLHGNFCQEFRTRTEHDAKIAVMYTGVSVRMF